MEISAGMVKELREKTGAGIMDCKEALAASEGAMEDAVDYLRKKGLQAADKRSARATREGVVHSYIHGGGRLGVLVEVNCETDFVARTDDFQELCKDLGMQIAASNPQYVSIDQVPEEAIAKERNILQEQARQSGRPENVIEKIVDGRMQKYYQEVCLLEQPFVKDTDRTVNDVLRDNIAKLGENISVARFARFVLGDSA
ncbi:translation elongation factor Ts [Candidatus Entotheonella palauensis]|uniref:Elongation factor Ts n=1 Tax=Candidatus Entotheonella gemina TaxID=1429439 RepID=W4LEQ9_9BACT|nr:translation elongation factor Ts [Candidatus Entotheonella palauensis]ETW96588.1 MAG: elongation factor Ts [Candidatus Entotheonella gemina]